MNHGWIDGNIDQKMKQKKKGEEGWVRGRTVIKTIEAQSEDMSLKENSIALSLNYYESCAFPSFLMECY